MKHFLRSCLTVLASVFYFATLSAQTACPIDSTITYDENDNPVYKTEYSYDAQGRINGTTTYRWENNVLIGDSKTFTVFDGSGRHITDVNYLWDATRNRWIGVDSTVTVYTGSNITEKTIYAWDTATDNWIGQTRYTYTYFNNNANKKTLELEEHWDSNTSTWVGYKKSERTYDASGNLTLEIAGQSYNTTTSSWYGGTKKVNGYTSGKQTLSEAYTWDSSHNGGAWKGNNNGKTTWTFNTYGNQTNKTIYTWNTSTWNWKNASKTDNTYDGSSTRKTDDASYTWNGSTWIGSGTRTIKRYSNTRPTSTTTYTWSNGAWVYASLDSTAYDGTSTRKTETVKYNWSNNAWAGTGTRTTYVYDGARETNKTTYTWSNGAWVNATKVETSYDGTSTRKTDIANYTWNGSDWIGTGTRTTTTYNAAADNKEEDIIYYTWQNSQWTKTTKAHKDYNASKVLIATINSSWNGTEWINTTKTSTTYSGSTKLSDDSYSWNSDILDWTLTGQTTYYSWGKITTQLTNDVWIRTSGDSTYTTVVGTETTTGKLTWNATTNTWGNKNDSQKVTSIEPNSKTVSEYRMNNAGNWNNYSKTEFIYDDNNNTIFEGVYTGSGTTWVPKQKTEQLFDNANHQLLYAQYLGVSGEWMGVTKTSHTYNGNLITSDTSYNWISDTWVVSYCITYT